jgi:hypothetical protein
LPTGIGHGLLRLHFYGRARSSRKMMQNYATR